MTREQFEQVKADQFEHVKTEAIRRGYTFTSVVVDGWIEEHMVRPNGTVAIIARKEVDNKTKAGV